MRPAQLKILLVSAAVTCGIGLLAVESSRSATVYYQTLPEFLAGAAPSGDRPVRITGYVVPGTIERRAGQPLVFMMQDKEHKLRMKVAYGDLVPDTFKDRAEVVVEGHLGPDRTFQASTLLAKCPSKYESAEKGGAAGAVPRT